MLGVGDCIADDAFEEGLENTTGLFVNHYGKKRQQQVRQRRVLDIESKYSRG